MTPEAMKGWTAGIIDGEGSVGWQKHGKGTGKCPIVQVTNTDEPICRLLHDYWGGRLHYYETRKDRPNNKPLWQWRIMGKECREFLEQIGTFLVGQKRQRAKDVLNGN